MIVNLMENIIFGTSNQNKLKEASDILWVKLSGYTKYDLQKIKKLTEGDIPEIQSKDIKIIAELKAKAVYDLLWKIIVVEDSWFFIK